MNQRCMETPFYLMYGRDVVLPIDAVLSQPTKKYASPDDYREEVVRCTQKAHYLAQEHLQKAQQKQKRIYDERAKQRIFRVGDKVMVYNPATPKGLSPKLSHLRHGPYRKHRW